MSQQELDDLMEIENLVNNTPGKEQNGFAGLPNSTMDSQFQFTAWEVLQKKAFIQDNIEEQNSEIVTLIQNSGNQIGGVDVGFQMMSPSSVAEQEVISSFGTINWDDIEYESQLSLITDLKSTSNNSVVGVEENKAFQDNNDALHTTPRTNQVSPVDPKCTDSSMSNEELKRIENAVEDPTANIDFFSNYLNQNGDTEDNNTVSDQAMDDLISIIENEQTGSAETIKCQNAQQGLCDSTDDTKIPLFVQEIVAQDNIKEKNNDVDAMILNTGNQNGGLQYEIKFPSLNLFSEQETNSSFSTINWENCENKSQFPQLIDFKPPMNSSVEEDRKACHNLTGASRLTYLPNQLPALNSSSIQVTRPNNVKIEASNPGPLRTKVGRCSRDEVPLYLMQEPADKQEKRRWRRAKTAYEHRVSKKTTLDVNMKKIEDLQNELNDMRNQLNIVTAERDAIKHSFVVLSARTRN